MVIGTTTVLATNINAATHSGSTDSVVISTEAGVTFVATGDILIGSTTILATKINTATQSKALATTILASTITAATNNQQTALGPCTSNGQYVTIQFTSPANLIGVKDLVLSQWYSEDEWTMAITSQDITEEIGVIVSQKEWTLSITKQAITQSAGVTVTQGSVTGTLKTALTGDSTSVVISTAADVVFVATTDVVIGSTTVVLANIATATNSLSVVGTLKTALTGAGMTDVVINTASGVSFVITSDLIIGSSTVLLANVNTATNNGATTSVVVSTASGINFLTSADVLIGSTTVAHANVNTATNSLTTTTIIVHASSDVTFDTDSNIVIGSTTIISSNLNTIVNTGNIAIDGWFVQKKAKVHVSKTTEVQTVIVESSDLNGGSSGGLQVQTGDYIGLMNIGWEVFSGTTCHSLTTRTTCMTASNSECFWDNGLTYHYLAVGNALDLPDGDSNVAWGPDPLNYDAAQCRLRQDYAQLWLDTNVLSSFQSESLNGPAVLGMYSDDGADTFLKTFDSISAMSISGLDGLTSISMGTTLSVRGTAPLAQPGYQIEIDPIQTICNSENVISTWKGIGTFSEARGRRIKIEFNDPLDAGNQPVLSISETNFQFIDDKVHIMETSIGGFINACPTLTSSTIVRESNQAAILTSKIKNGYGGRVQDDTGASINILSVRKGFSGSTNVIGGALVSVLPREITRGVAVGTARTGGDTLGGRNDYIAVDTVLTFQPFVTELTLTVEILNDQTFEYPDEFVRLYLTEPKLYPSSRVPEIAWPSSITFGTSEMTLEILDDGDSGIFSFSSRYFSVEEANTTMLVTVTRTDRDFNAGANGGAVVVAYETQQRWATPSSSFTYMTWFMTMSSATLMKSIGEVVTQQNQWTLNINAQNIVQNVGVTVTQSEWTLGITSQNIVENAGVTVSQNEWTIAINSQAITAVAGVTVTQGIGANLVTGTIKTPLTGAGMTSVVISAGPG